MLQILSRPKPKPQRSSAKIIADILDVIRTGERITRICTRANIGGDVVVQYLDFMIKIGMIEKIVKQDHIIYKPLEKGITNYTLLLELASFRIIRKNYHKR